MDNKSAFSAAAYDSQIRKTLPFYDEFYKQVIDLVSVCKHDATRWLDVGCGTGKMAEMALEKFALEQVVCCDCSEEMLEMAKKRIGCEETKFELCDVREMSYSGEFDVVTAIQVNHYLQKEERKIALRKCYEALKEKGLFISFENFAPFSDWGKEVYLRKWRDYQMQQGKDADECERHISRYGVHYFPISLIEHLELMRDTGFRAVEILWVSNMQAGIWGMK